MSRYIRWQLPVVIMIAALMLSSCSEGPYYDQGYEDGYKAGFAAGADDSFGNGYSEGYYDGFHEGEKDDETETKAIWEIVEEASWYAKEHGCWSVYEASENISLYLNGEKTITEEEYKQSVLTLTYFYEYFEQHEYE